MKRILYPMFGGNAFDESAMEDYANKGEASAQQESNGQPSEKA